MSFARLRYITQICSVTQYQIIPFLSVSFQASDILKIHQGKCKETEKSLQISCDGMSESKSTAISLDVYSARMHHCRVIYPFRIVRPLHKGLVDNQHQFSLFVNEIVQNNWNIKAFVADNLKRCIGKNVLSHSSLHPCEYCFARGCRLKIQCDVNSTKQFKLMREKIRTDGDNENMNFLREKIDKAEKELKTSTRSRIVWPASTMNGEPRTTEKLLEIVEKTENANGVKLPLNEAKGVVGRSCLYDVPNFDITRDSPTEYLHSVCLGVGKRMVELCFNVGENRKRETKRKLSSPALFNKLMINIKVTRECSRRVRDLDFALYKGQEYRNLILFFFPVIIDCIENEAKERKLWLQFSFMIRACTIPNNEFKQIDLNWIENTAKEFYVLYEKLFGAQNCTYYTHIVCCHLLEMRYHGPLTLTSAFGFESFYGEVRHSFMPGTQSTLKQIFQKVLIKRALGYHSCKSPITYSDSETAMENNTLIYCYQDFNHKMYKIVENHDDYVMCVRQGKYDHKFKETPNLPWSKVGVYRQGPLSTEKEKIMKKNIGGKVFQVNNLLITCANNILREK